MGRNMKNRNYDQILKHFIVMWLLTVAGVIIAIWLPLSIVILLSILCIAVIVIIVLLEIGSGIIYVIPFLMGILHFLVILLFIEWLGAALVISVFIGIVVVFLLIGFVGLRYVIFISEALIYFFTILIVIVVFGFIYIFVPVSSLFFLTLAGIFVLCLALFTVYQIDLLRGNFVQEGFILLFAFKLYLSFGFFIVNYILSFRKTKW